MPSEPKFVFLIAAYNVRPFLGALVASLAFQRYTGWSAIFIDDASTDGTLNALQALLAAHRLTEQFHVVENPERQYKARNVFQALSQHGAADDVVVILDGDDHLAEDDALDRLAREYKQGWEIVWSNWRGTDGRRGTSSHLNPFVSPRRQRFVSGHLFSFKHALFAALVERDFQDQQGRWLEAGCDVALALPILDQTIKRKHIEDVLLVYNRANPLSHARASSALPGSKPGLRATPLQAQTLQMLRRRPAKPLTLDREFLQAHLYELLQAAAISSFAATQRQIASAQRPPQPG